MHVFSDLMPYICTFDGCPNKLRCFPSRSAWANHEFQEHRFDRYWACPECPEKSCSTVDWEHHLNSVHSQKFSGPNLVSARNAACRISPKHGEEEECPFCRVVLRKPRRAFVKHVSRHMEDIALMALPSNAEEDSEIGSISTNDTSHFLGGIDHFCVDCGPRPLDTRIAIKQRVYPRAEIGPDALSMQTPRHVQSFAKDEQPQPNMMQGTTATAPEPLAPQPDPNAMQLFDANDVGFRSLLHALKHIIC